MDKKNYEPPTINCLGSVRDLTAFVGPPCEGSLEPEDFQDAICVIQNP
ncbi:MAG TPA: hypothetical protein VFH11_04145 [Gemmatimonadota bacterium]|nr:hypothetical protein [Gemmatimonadota bacterium]